MTPSTARILAFILVAATGLITERQKQSAVRILIWVAAMLLFNLILVKLGGMPQ